MEIGQPVEELFDPKVHLQYVSPTTKYTFADLGLNSSPTSTEVAATTPFSFLSPEGVRAYRRAITATDVLKNCSYSPFKNTLVLRNVQKYSKFIRDLWTHSETLKIIQEVAGVPLVPYIPYDIGQTNVQVHGSSVEEMVTEILAEPSTAIRELTDEEKQFNPLKENSIIPWHYDSYPYVLVVMLSNTVGMVGGETYIRKGDGTAVKVEGPSIGHGVFLQGGEVQHLAARAIGVDERIATITSMRADVPGLYDSSYLTNVRPVSKLPDLYQEWIHCRLEKMKNEITRLQYALDTTSSGDHIDVPFIQNFANAQIEYLRRTVDQLVDYDLHDKVMKRFGQDTYYAVEDHWKRVTAQPEAAEKLRASDEALYRPGSHLWGDLYMSRKAIERGEMLGSQLHGMTYWSEKRSYVMGDELLRQGLREEFFEWLVAAGLDRL